MKGKVCAVRLLSLDYRDLKCLGPKMNRGFKLSTGMSSAS